MNLLAKLKSSAGQVIPAAGDGVSFKQFSYTNAPAIFLAASLVSQNLIAEEDEGLLSITEYAAFALQMNIKKRQTLILDLQSGFGNPLNTYYAVQKLERNGGDILLLNDQTYPSHTTKSAQITSAADFVGKIRASLDSFEDPATQLWVRLDGIHSYGVYGLLQRIQYAANAGAQAVVVNQAGLADWQELLQQNPALPLLASGQLPVEFAGIVGYLADTSFIHQSQKLQQERIDAIDWGSNLDA